MKLKVYEQHEPPLSEIGKCAETMVDGITLVNQYDVFAQEFGDSDYDYVLEFLKTKMIEHLN